MLPLPDDRDLPEPQPLDDEHVLEPVPEEAGLEPGEPVVRDVQGRLWRVRRRPGSELALTWTAVAATVVLAIAVVLWLLV